MEDDKSMEKVTETLKDFWNVNLEERISDTPPFQMPEEQSRMLSFKWRKMFYFSSSTFQKLQRLFHESNSYDFIEAEKSKSQKVYTHSDTHESMEAGKSSNIFPIIAGQKYTKLMEYPQGQAIELETDDLFQALPQIELTPKFDANLMGYNFTNQLPFTFKLAIWLTNQFQLITNTKPWETMANVDHHDKRFITFQTDHFSFFKAFLEKHMKGQITDFCVTQIFSKELTTSIPQFGLNKMSFLSAIQWNGTPQTMTNENQGQNILSTKNTSNTVLKIVGTKGGKLESDGCSLVIPTNALTQDVLITITPYKFNTVGLYIQ
uniref:Uncharacterized protein LOC108949854 n=1 Tax=Phallusia mammillata TaxID=59560 RepID=A0A6F9DK43_9ASCI|nr:uncharacterized protein LOC108949854 [Phallusia mammillata]